MRPTTPQPLDSFDQRLLELLQQDADLTLDALGEAVGLSPSAVQRRIKRYREHGMRRIALVDPQALATATLVMVTVRMEHESAHDIKMFYARMQAAPEVQQCYTLAGEWDYLLMVATPSVQEYRALVERLLKPQKNIKRFESRVVLDTVKRGLALPTRASR